MTHPATRILGRTGREITTLGLGGQASIQWPGPGSDPVAIIEKAHKLGINYMDTSNIYGPSQKHFGEAFRRLGISPAADNYDPEARKRLFVATKTHIRTARRPQGERFPTDFSEGMIDEWNVSTAVDDLRRSLSLLFGDGRGEYPEDAYIDAVQIHNINTQSEIDMIFEGLDNPSPERPWLGALPALLDFREGTDRTGLNPKREKRIRHIGITGHWNTAALVYAIRKDVLRIIDTLLVTINPADPLYMSHRHNAIATAAAAGMGVIGMKVFADAAYYHKGAYFSGSPEDVYHEIGSDELPSRGLIQYALSVEGVSGIITGIGRVDDDPARCQLTANLDAAQMEKLLNGNQMEEIEKMLAATGKTSANAYFQRKSEGLTPPSGVSAESDSPMPLMNRLAVRVSWDASYAGAHRVERYEVLRDGEIIGTVPHRPQTSLVKFHFDDRFREDPGTKRFSYAVRAVDSAGNTAQSPPIEAGPSASE